MRGGQLVHVVRLTARRALAVEFRAVPRCLAVFLVVLGIRQHVVGLAQHFVRALVAVLARRFGVRNRVRQIAEVRRLPDGSAIADRAVVVGVVEHAATTNNGDSNASRHARRATSLSHRLRSRLSRCDFRRARRDGLPQLMNGERVHAAVVVPRDDVEVVQAYPILERRRCHPFGTSRPRPHPATPFTVTPSARSCPTVYEQIQTLVRRRRRPAASLIDAGSTT